MALKVNYDAEGDFYHDAYVMIKKIISANDFIEHYEEQEDGLIKLKYEKIFTNIAYIYVFPDHAARLNNAMPVHTFGIEFEYDGSDNLNIYSAAYEALKNTKRFADEHIENV
jgi:hypothetical protein